MLCLYSEKFSAASYEIFYMLNAVQLFLITSYILLPGLLSLVDSQTAILSQTLRKLQEGRTS